MLCTLAIFGCGSLGPSCALVIWATSLKNLFQAFDLICWYTHQLALICPTFFIIRAHSLSLSLSPITNAHRYTHALSVIPIYVHNLSHMHAHTHTCTHTLTSYAHSFICLHSLCTSLSFTFIHSHILKHTSTRMLTHINTHTQACPHTHARTFSLGRTDRFLRLSMFHPFYLFCMIPDFDHRSILVTKSEPMTAMIRFRRKNNCFHGSEEKIIIFGQYIFCTTSLPLASTRWV